ncbi:hydrogenase maturation protease [Microcoleus sp. T3_A4]|uniref:hydrogenase maturation protease n=1 Tax=Microcoleus sp. T3_A4 TaxID=2818968 RepID=UPI002FCF37C8
MNITDNKKISYLIIGYGNTIRGDDGAGYQVAETVAQWNFNDVRSLAVHQLTPDLAEAIAQAKTVIFVDVVTTTLSEVKIEQLRPNYAASFTGHYADPRSMLALTCSLYKAIPTAYQILIPAVNFSFGETLSPVTRKNVDLALVKIKQLVSQQSSRRITTYDKTL